MFGTNHLIIDYINASFTINRRHRGSDPNTMTIPYATTTMIFTVDHYSLASTTVILADGPYVNDLILAWCQRSAVTVI